MSASVFVKDLFIKLNDSNRVIGISDNGRKAMKQNGKTFYNYIHFTKLLTGCICRNCKTQLLVKIAVASSLIVAGPNKAEGKTLSGTTSPKLNSKKNNLKDLTRSAILAILLLAGNQAEGKVLPGTTSQKQAVEQLIQEGKLLPNVPTDYGHYGRNYLSGDFAYNIAPYGDHRQRYQADNLADIDGKDLTIQNDIDSCNFLNESVYKSNLDKIVPIIIDTQIDTLNAARGEYERVDRENSKDFTGKGMTVENAGLNLHMNAVANVLVAKKNNFTEEDYDKGLDGKRGREDVGVYPGKTRLYVNSDLNGGGYNNETFEYLCNEVESHPDKRYILSCSRGGADDVVKYGFTKLGVLDNVIIFVARSDPKHSSSDSYSAHPATIEVGFVKMPSINMESGTQRISFAGEEKDRIVPNPGTGQTGKMRGDGFSVLGEWSTSEATAFMTGIVSNIRAQNPDRTKDEVIAMLKRDVYKPMPGKMTAFDQATQTNYTSNVTYDANGWNEWIGYGVVQPGKTMKENIFPEIPEILTTADSLYRFTVSNFPSSYTITGPHIQKDNTGYYVDLSSLPSGKYAYTFLGECRYNDSIYIFPIHRTLILTDPLQTKYPYVNSFAIYPNPVDDILTINLPFGSLIRDVRIYALSGQLCLAFGNKHSNTLITDLSNLSPGIYRLVITDTEGNTYTDKIIKK